MPGDGRLALCQGDINVFNYLFRDREVVGVVDWEQARDVQLRNHERGPGRANGRIKGFLSPMQVDTCSPELLRLSRQASDSMRVPLALHVSQSVYEFDEIVRRHGDGDGPGAGKAQERVALVPIARPDDEVVIQVRRRQLAVQLEGRPEHGRLPFQLLWNRALDERHGQDLACGLAPADLPGQPGQ